MTFFKSTIVISDIHNVILPRTNYVTFAIHVYSSFNVRFPQFHFIISAIKFLLGKTPISDIYNSVVSSLGYPELHSD